MECLVAAEELAKQLCGYVARSVSAHGGSTAALNPGKRVPFNWPTRPESYGFHIRASDWKPAGPLEIGAEEFYFEIADTPLGLFGRVPDLWYETRAADKGQLCRKLIDGVQPLLERQRLVAQVLERTRRFTDHISELEPLDLLKLLYCPDRDIVNDSRIAIETHASTGYFFPSLIFILEDQTHPYRRCAQWAVLDLFEDLASFVRTKEDWQTTVNHVKGLIWCAEDDYARVTYKAGVVLGGHMPFAYGAQALIECLRAPSRLGRRSAIHGLYHVAEWAPDRVDEIVSELTQAGEKDEEPLLRGYARRMAEDILRGDTVHAEDIVFPDEPV